MRLLQGCKTFFRRTVVSGRNFNCKKGGNCQFDKNRRCACRACRFQQCVSVGMNPQAIQYTPSANLTLSIARKRFQRNQRCYDGSRVVPQVIVGVQEDILRRIGHVLHLEEKHDRLRSSTFFPYSVNMTLEDVVRKPTVFGDAEKYQLVEKWPKRPSCFIFNKEKYIDLGIKMWVWVDYYLSVDYTKTYDVFSSLTSVEKLSLVKSTVIPLSLLSAAYFAYLQRSEIVCYPDGSYPFNYRKENLIEIERVVRRGVVPHVHSLKPDQIQYCLLRALTALNDAAPDLSEEGRLLISEERSKYTTVLLRYLQNKHGTDMGTRKFGETMAMLTRLYEAPQANKEYFAYRKYVLKTTDTSAFFQDCLRETISL